MREKVFEFDSNKNGCELGIPVAPELPALRWPNSNWASFSETITSLKMIDNLNQCLLLLRIYKYLQIDLLNYNR